MKTYHINFSDSIKYSETIEFCNHTAKRVAGFDHVFSYNLNDIDKEFYLKNQHIFSQSRGAGYWLWKPYFLKKTLEKLRHGDLLVYSDACSYYISSIDPLKKLIKKDSKGILSFELHGLSEKKYTKRDAIELMNLNNSKFVDTFQREASFIWIIKNDFTIDFIDEFLKYAQNEQILTDMKGCENYPEFIDHRHDQSIWSLLCKKYSIEPHRLISQYGLSVMNDYPNDLTYGQITVHHRNPNFAFPDFIRIDKSLNNLKTGVIIASTSKNCTWSSPQECYLNSTLNSICETVQDFLSLRIYVGIDEDDPFYKNERNRSFFETNYNVQFMITSAAKGHVTKIWNELAKKAISENCEYLFQCGDDITFHRSGWLEECKYVLKSKQNIGMTGPLTNQNSQIITQCFVHRTHYDILGYFFPEEIKNWFCDDWINELYPSLRICNSYNCDNKVVANEHEPARYEAVNCRSLCTELVIRDSKKIEDFLNKHNKNPSKEILLSVLILSIPSRLQKLSALYSNLTQQIGNSKSVEILTLVDNKIISIGAKRQSILDISRGKYIAYLDDDDNISHDYIDRLLHAIKKGKDVITFEQHCTVNKKEFNVSFQMNNPHEKLKLNINGSYEDIRRPPYHMCAWSSKIAKQIKFKDISYGEDWDWCSRLYQFVRSETHIDKVLHYYLYSDETSESIQFKK